MKLPAFFVSSNGVVRGITWLVTFLLLTAFWILLLPLFSLNNLYQYLGSLGMTGTQSVITMTLLPSTILTLIGWIGLHVFTSSVASSPAVADAANVQSSPLSKSTPTTSLTGKLRIGAWGLVTPFGDASATVTRSRKQERAFRPDKIIRNEDGHPVHAAVVEELPLEILNYPVETRSRAMRVSAMLVTVLNTLFDQQADLARSTTAPAKVYWLVPEALPLNNETRLSFSIAWTHSLWRNVDYDLQLLPAATESAYGVVNALQQHMSPSKMPYVLLLAADSLVNPDELLTSLALDQVFSNRTPDGFVPAEGAAGLLLVDAAYAQASELVDGCTLGTVHRGQRTEDRGTKGKLDSGTLVTCITEAMAAAQTTADKIGIVISDTDHRMPRSQEVIHAMEKVLPNLDPLSQRIAPMALAGSFGAASDLIHIALAAEMAATTEQAALFVSVANVRQTTAMVIMPDTV
ncbi:hypothetical protein CFter6_2861 [Collimonas fungivorans]|uniref:Transmembrane protein n=1 Tax=Collimonas fungivorans TaxID=158899 RepID=A0A127PCR5_9BURK|nr:hypothetical protein [Collimonas fungivorans]AMO95527.1 hypothetical protein CFter6_2861 [Collimonas fungivorans]